MKQFSAQQRKVLSEDRIRFLGVDEKGRPVVEGEFGIPRQMRRWALLRNGDPADITGQVKGSE